MSCEDRNYHFTLMPAKLKQVVSSLLARSLYKQLAVSVAWLTVFEMFADFVPYFRVFAVSVIPNKTEVQFLGCIVYTS
jgi:hypothetical protein